MPLEAELTGLDGMYLTRGTLEFYGDRLAGENGEDAYFPRTVEGTYDDVEVVTGLPQSTRNDIRYIEECDADDCRLEFDTVDDYIAGTKDATKELLHYVWDADNDVFIMDDHKHALAAWTASYNENAYSGNTYVLHVDAHWDNASPIMRDAPPCTVEAAEQYIGSGMHVSIASFIEPAILWGLVDDVFNWGPDDAEQATADRYPLAAFEKAADMADTLVLDLDLDVFEQEFTKDYDIDTLYRTIADTIQNAEITTIATSPGYTSQDDAVDHLKQIYSHLDV